MYFRFVNDVMFSHNRPKYRYKPPVFDVANYSPLLARWHRWIATRGRSLISSIALFHL